MKNRDEAAAPAGAKSIPPARDQLQSRLLTGIMLPVLVLLAILSIGSVGLRGLYESQRLLPASLLLGLSLTFAAAVWALRAATAPAAVSGGLISFIVLSATTSEILPQVGQAYPRWIFGSGLTPLLLLFVLTFAATRAGRRRKLRAGLAEGRKGRNAGQIIANLGAAALVCLPSAISNLASPRRYHAYPFGSSAVAVLLLAVLAEATADTVSSETGQAFGGKPRMLTTLELVPAGTDGAISLRGTLAGLAASGLLVGAGAYALAMPAEAASIAWLAGTAGLLFDSLLGATVERRGWLGNDLVNFTSTLFAGAVAYALRAAALFPGH